MPTSDIQSIIFLSKICFVLTLAWCLRFAIGNRNPKGVVLIWRIHFVALSLVCVGLFLPPLWSLSSFPLIDIRSPVAIAVHSSTGPKFSDLGSDLGSGSFGESLLVDGSGPRPSPNYMSSRELVLTERQSETEVTADNFESIDDPAENRSVVVLQTQDAIALPLVPNGALQSGNGTENMALTRPFQITGSVSNDRARTLSGSLIWLWLAGVAVGLCRLLAMFAWIRDLDRKAVTFSLDCLCLPPWLCSRVKTSRVQIKGTQSVASPCLIGVFKPVILLPTALLEDTQSSSSIHAAIAHELMHLKGGDMLWHFLMQAQQTILWPLPLVWWISRSHLFACERICDESASELTQNRERYRSDLAKLALAVLHSNHQTFSLSMVKQPEINRRLALLALRPPILHVGLYLKAAFVATILVSILLGVTGSSELTTDVSVSTTSDGGNQAIVNESIVNGSIVNGSIVNGSIVNGSIVNGSASGSEIQPGISADSFDNSSAVTDAPREIVLTIVQAIAASLTADNAIALQSKTATSQSFTVHSHLDHSTPKKRIKPSPVNSGRLVRGSVSDMDGLPIANATLTIGMFTLDNPDSQSQNKTIPLIKFKTDSNGNWQWNQATSLAVLGLRVAKDGFVSRSFEFAEGVTNYDLKLVKAISVKGKLLDENGQPVQGVRIFAEKSFQFFYRESASGHPNQGPSRSSQKETDSLGNWQIDNWYEESISVVAASKDGRLAILENVNARSEQLLEFRPIKMVSVRVVDSAQNPVVDASVRAQGWWREHVSKVSALTNANGEVILRSIPSVDLLWMIEKPGYRTARFVMPRGDIQLDPIPLLKPQTLKAQIVDDATGQSIKNSRVHYQLGRRDFTELAATERRPIVNGVTTNGDTYFRDIQSEVPIADGNVQITCDLEFRFLSMTILADGYETLRADPISSQKEQVVRQFRLKKGDGFSVIDVDGKPAADCYVLFDPKEPINPVNFDRNLLPEGTKRAGNLGHVSVDPKTPRSTLVIAWSQNGYGMRPLSELGSSQPLQLEPWASVTLLDQDNQLDSEETTSHVPKNSDGDRVFQRLPHDRGSMLLASWNQQAQKQMTTIRLNVSPGQSLRFNPLGKNRVQGQIDLATLGQPFLSEHSINIEAVSTTCNDRVAVIHKCEVGANGEFSFEHLGAGIYRLRISAVQLDDNEIIEHAPRRYPWLTCGFEFESREPETEKNLGLIPCVFAEYDRYGTNRIVEPIGDMNSNRDVDDFKNEQPIRFVTIKKNWPSQDITFWNSKGEALRTISKKSVSMFERNIFEQFEFARNKSRFFLSAIGEITSYDFYGTRVWDTKWNGWYKLGIAGLHGDDLQVYQPLIMSSISLLPQDSLRLQETTVPLADCSQCKFSERDGLYWSLGKKLRSFDKAGKLISNVNFLNLHALYAYGNQLSLDEVNGGCWCICIEHTFNGDVQTLNRFDSSGKLKFSKYLPPPKSPKLFPMAVAGGNCYVGESNRVVGFAPDGQNLSELPIDAKSIAATSDTNTLWALTKDGLCKIDTSGHSMVVTETIPGITGDQLFILD